MIIFKKIAGIREKLGMLRHKGNIGFVPTMGALHDGHLELLHTARKENMFTVASIFVNPTQFNDPKDFQKYPITIEKDIDKLIRAGCDLLFLPDQDEIYPGGFTALEDYDLGNLDQILEGKFRPGHFQGVCRVVNRLLDAVEPDCLYLGQKDYQQCLVIRRLLDITGRGTSLRICDTVREPDGLAMSSRNMRLSPSQRAIAPNIYKVLQHCYKHLHEGNLQTLRNEAFSELTREGFRVDYLEFAHAFSLEIKTSWNGIEPLVVLVAVFMEDVRLIDNKLLTLYPMSN
jgi:pantoate--beta-alanine ligase